MVALLACFAIVLSLPCALAQMPLMAEPLALLPMLPPGLIPAPLLGAANGQGPTLAGSWSADIVQYTGGMVTKGHMFYDRTHQRIRQIIDSHQAIFTQDDRMHFDSVTVNATGLNQNVTVGLGADAVCKAMSMPYVDQFAVFALAHHTGSGVVDGVPCEVWTAEVPSANASACIAADGVPRELNSSAGWGLTRVRLGNVTVGPLDPAIFAISLACANRYPTKPCPEGGPRTFSVYRIHGAEEPPELTDRNVGDGLGDMSFVCAIGALEAYRTKLVSSWVLTANASWGQYAYCRFMGGKNSCYGGTGKQVGRESAMGLGKGHLQGQCSTNDDTGSWYSFPGTGECLPGAPVGTDGCSWGLALRKRTVAASCILQDRGLAKVCSEERGHAPYTRSAAIFRAALASSDPSKGGCPDVAPRVFVV
mmetsp:Transcript_131742/g.328529  ORF Transcript_131742/g.328529 Transcript_131742/m.328529 type:complete len:421 (-) Transcript_131742:144-1406(-)